jgi:soluble lytic murein transglycosylase-like protein
LSAALSPAGLSTDWDPVFERHRGRIPLAYLRALAKRESDFSPGNTSGGAWGLLEVTMDVVFGFNKRNPGKSYTSADRLDPSRNVEMATWQLREVIRSYRENHRSKNLQENWNNHEFVALLTMGWNAGYSELGGVGRVADYLELRGIPVTAGNVARYASAAGAVSHLAERGAGWARAVTALYFFDRQPDPPRVLASNRFSQAAAFAGLLAMSTATGLALAMRAGHRGRQ